MRLLNSFLFSSLLIGQIYNLPFDWSGQFGISTVDGRLFWNSDWTSGPLLFDGTYTHYPLRYGNAISALFQPAGTHLIPLTIYQLPDTTSTTTTLDYERGDYNYDLLAIDADFKTPGRSVGLHGFKRSYAGREGQFFHPKGNTSPLQQTYKVDYRSENKGWLIDASTARLVTESGLPDSGAVNGLLEDEILTAGIITRSPGEKLQWTSHFALFQQWRRIDASWYGDRKKQFISRRMWKQELDGFNIEGFSTSLGMDLNKQSISKTDTVKRDIDWAVAYARVKWKGINASFGGSYFSSDETYRNISVEYSNSWKFLSINTEFSEQYRPTHIHIWEANHNDLIERFIRGVLSINAEFKNVKTGINYFNGVSKINSVERGDYSTVELFNQLVLYKQLSFKGSYSLQKGNFYLSDEIGKKIQFQLAYKKEHFFNRFDLSANLYGEGLLNRKESNLLSPLDGVSLENAGTSLNLSDIWLLNFDVSATISTMTITWSVRNILQAIEPFALKMFPDKQEGDFLIQHHSTFPPMGRLVSFGIHWTFKD